MNLYRENGFRDMQVNSKFWTTIAARWRHRGDRYDRRGSAVVRLEPELTGIQQLIHGILPTLSSSEGQPFSDQCGFERDAILAYYYTTVSQRHLRVEF